MKEFKEHKHKTYIDKFLDGTDMEFRIKKFEKEGEITTYSATIRGLFLFSGDGLLVPFKANGTEFYSVLRDSYSIIRQLEDYKRPFSKISVEFREDGYNMAVLTYIPDLKGSSRALSVLRLCEAMSVMGRLLDLDNPHFILGDREMAKAAIRDGYYGANYEFKLCNEDYDLIRIAKEVNRVANLITN